MSDIVVILRGDRAEIEPFLTTSEQDPAVRTRLCDLLDHHCQLEDTLLFPALVSTHNRWEETVTLATEEHAQIQDLLSAIRTSRRTLDSDLVALLRDHLDADEATILGPAARDLSDEVRAELADLAPSLPPPAPEALAAGDPGASSDGDQSWARAPLTQDPEVDRSVDATIRRTGGR